jgi:hypothetical protein
MRRSLLLLVRCVSHSLARAPRPDEEAEVGCTNDTVALDIGALDDRPIGIPDSDQKPKFRGIDLAILVKIPRAWNPRSRSVPRGGRSSFARCQPMSGPPEALAHHGLNRNDPRESGDATHSHLFFRRRQNALKPHSWLKGVVDDWVPENRFS